MKEIKTEGDVKELVKAWYTAGKGWSYAPIQNGLGVHGIHDRVGVIPIQVTQAMVGRTVGLFVSVESKRPGRRGEPRRGMSQHQKDMLDDVTAASGLAICCDGPEDLAQLDRAIRCLLRGYEVA